MDSGSPYREIDAKITGIRGFALSSPYGSGASLGQPLGVKSVGLVEVLTDAGVTGLGETYAGVYVPELIEPTASFFESLLMGTTLGDDDALDRVSDIPFVGRNGLLRSVLSAIDIAIWDIRGKLLGRPVHSLLGFNAISKVPVYASGGTAVFSPGEIRRDVEAAIGLGHRAYKMRIGYQDWRTDLERINVARVALGDGRDLMADAIMGTLRPTWPVDLAKERATSLKGFDLRWLEEPLHPDDIDGLATLRNWTGGFPPIAAGEAYTSYSEYRTLLDKGAVDVMQFDATHSGGISGCLRLARDASNAGLNSALHVWGSSIALAANAQFAIGAGIVDILEIPMVQLAVAEEMWIDRPKISDGHLELSDAPGLGVQITPAIRERYCFVPGSGYRLPS